MSSEAGITKLRKALLDSSLEDITAYTDALHLKFTYNISQLSSKNQTLSELLVQASGREKQAMEQEAEDTRAIIKACLGLQDSFLNMDVLAKKSELLKQHTAKILLQMQNQLADFKAKRTATNKPN